VVGKKRPTVLGKEGAEAGLERGEKTLADILNRANDYDEDSFGGESGGETQRLCGPMISSFRRKWADRFPPMSIMDLLFVPCR